MKRVLSLILVLVMILSFAACSSEKDNSAAVKKYIDENGDDYLEALEYSFAASSGLTCKSDIEAVGNGFVSNIRINEFDDLPSDIKAQMQSAYDSMGSTFEGLLEDLQDECPEIEYFTINVCEQDGDIIAVITAGKK